VILPLRAAVCAVAMDAQKVKISKKRQILDFIISSILILIAVDALRAGSFKTRTSKPSQKASSTEN
jgi:hypothetical protein